MKRQNIVVTIGEYIDKQGIKKKKFLTIGELLTDDKGGQFGTIKCVPVNRDGKFSIYDQKDKEEKLF